MPDPTPCNCILMWNWIRETHIWINGSFDGSCGHPVTGTTFEADQ